MTFSYSDKEVLIVYEDNKKSFMRIYDMKSVMNEKSDKKLDPKYEIPSPGEHAFTSAVWGALDKCLYASTTSGKVFCIDVESGKEMYHA